MYYLGFDIGGSSTKAVLVKEKQILKSLVEDTPDNLDGLFKLARKMRDELVEGIIPDEIGGAGFAVAGVLDLGREKVLNSPNISYLNNQPLKKLAEEKLNWPIKLEHDTHCFLLAEKEIGSAQGFKNVFYLTLGTGIGGAFMVEGTVVFGAHGAAGELGHIIIDNSSGLEYEDMAADKFLKKSLGLGSMKARTLVESGNQKAIEVLKQMSNNLGIGVANIINILDPEAIIISGGISWAQDFLLVGINQAVEKFVNSPEAKKTKILFSELDRFGGALGAALMVEND